MYQDDNFGVEESLDEPGVDGRGLTARGQHWLILEAKKDQRNQRQLALELFHQPVVAFSPIKSASNFRSSVITDFTGIQKPLPENVHLLTLKQISKNSILLRLEHFLQNGEDLFLSQPATVDVDQIFSTLDVIAVEELLLAGNIRVGEKYDLPRSWNRSIRILNNVGKGLALTSLTLGPIIIFRKVHSPIKTNGNQNVAVGSQIPKRAFAEVKFLILAT